MGFEPTTYALRVRCSTPELKWHTVSYLYYNVRNVKYFFD